MTVSLPLIVTIYLYALIIIKKIYYHNNLYKWRLIYFMKKFNKIILFSFIIILIVFTAKVVAYSSVWQSKEADYDKLIGKYSNISFEQKVINCNSIPKNKLQTFLYGNHPGVQTYYERSFCFEQLAINERKLELCDYVKEHKAKALFLDGSDISKESCQKSVKEKIQNDKNDSKYYSGRQNIDQAFFTLDGNGKDYDFIIKTSGDKARPYKLTLELFDNEQILGTLYSGNNTFTPPTNTFRIYIKKTDLLNILKGIPLDKVYKAKLSLKLNLNDFLVNYIPEQDRIIEKYIDINFSKLTWKPTAY